MIAIEVKAGATVRSEDLADLRHLAQRAGQRLVAGYVLYTGQQTLPFGTASELSSHGIDSKRRVAIR